MGSLHGTRGHGPTRASSRGGRQTLAPCLRAHTGRTLSHTGHNVVPTAGHPYQDPRRRHRPWLSPGLLAALARPRPTTGPQGPEHTQAVSAQVSETARHIGETASAYDAQGREQIEDVGQYLEEHIRTKPLQSVVMAAGVGLLVGLLWKR